MNRFVFCFGRHAMLEQIVTFLSHIVVIEAYVVLNQDKVFGMIQSFVVAVGHTL